MPILWNFWLKNAYYSYTVHVTLFHGMLLQKRKHFLESSLFSMALSQLEKRKHSVLSLVKIKTKLSKNFPFAMKFGIFGNSNTQRWYVFWFGYFWTLPWPAQAAVKGKTWIERIFKIMAGWNNVSISSVNLAYCDLYSLQR